VKRALSVLLSAALLLALIPAGAVEFSFSAKAVTSGIYTYQIANFYTTITKVSTSASGHIAIPEELGNCPVTAIGKEAFSGCRNVTAVEIYDGITTIGEDAFYNSGIYRNAANWVDGLLYVDDCLVDAKVYQDEFEAVRKVSKGQKNPYQYVLKWFENRFPNYDGLPEFDEKLRLVNTPADYDSEEDAA